NFKRVRRVRGVRRVRSVRRVRRVRRVRGVRSVRSVRKGRNKPLAYTNVNKGLKKLFCSPLFGRGAGGEAFFTSSH
ncbi:MAG: hypothetical protein MR717_03720, partial [Prevotella sp.]|nr:hypothetical protein [Prevotella sp.]